MERRFHFDPMLALVLASVGISCGGTTDSAAGAGGHLTGDPGSGGTGTSDSGRLGTGAADARTLGNEAAVDGPPIGVGSGGTSDSGRLGTGATADARFVSAEGAVARPPIGVCTHEVIGDGNWITCDEGFKHRAVRAACTVTIPRGPTPPPDGGLPFQCASDASCSSLLYGHCSRRFKTPASCSAGCVTDDDCGASQICLCEGDVGECIQASCSVDADCGPGSLCATYEGVDGCSMGIVGVACQKPGDQCLGSDCSISHPTIQLPLCQLQGNLRACLPGTGGCGGRPFLVQGRERVAGVTVRADWLDAALPSVRTRSLSARDRARATEHWTLMAQMEHASIAAFARFSLELLALGAPADLVAEAARAMSDEQRHAARCFALAGTYAGQPLGPEPLSVDGALTTPTLESVLETTLLEGCIGELVAAAEARESASLATDPVVSRTLSEIADDESRHAALAWRFLGWAIERGGAPLLERMCRIASLELRRGGAASASVSHEASFEDASALGILPDAIRTRLRAEVIAQVVVPALDLMREARWAA